MPRIPTLDAAEAPRKTAQLLAAVERQMGGVPNVVGTLAQSAAALGGYLGLAGALAGGKLSAAQREQVALAVAGANGCDYCASAHTVLGGRSGLSGDEIARNLAGRSDDAKSQAALDFATAVVRLRGNLADEDLARVRAAGFDDEAVVELVANTVLNIFTNYLNHIAGTEIDFPVVRTGQAAAA